MQIEIELKLDLAASALERLRRHPVLREHRLGRAQSFHLYNTYYDTPDAVLLQHGAALRLRQNGTHLIQTVKARGHHQGAHFARPEWEWPIAGPDLDLSLLSETPLATLTPEQQTSLQPLFTTDFKRTVWLLQGVSEGKPWEAELTLDQGEVRGHGEQSGVSIPINEVEIELKRGTPCQLYALALRLTEGIVFRPSVISKAERGYRLALQRPSKAHRGSKSTLHKSQTVTEAFQTIGRDCLTHALMNEPLLRLDRKPEAIHQMRVALRRLRSAITLFKDVLATPQSLAIKEDLRWLASELGDARDLDVFLTEHLLPANAALEGVVSLQPILKEIASHREDAYQRALAALQTPRCGRVFLEIAAWLEGGDWLFPTDPARIELLQQPIKVFASTQMDKRLRAVLRAGRDFADLNSMARHALRIEVKKLRYASEFFTPLFNGKKTKPFQAALAPLQDILGVMNDTAVAHHRLLTLAASNPALLGLPCGAALGWLEAMAFDALHDCKKTWKRFHAHANAWGEKS